MSAHKTFCNLPPRVVIYDILPYHLFLFYPTLKSFDLFGYFKKDRSRHVWFLFSSIKIEEKDIAPPIIEDLEIPEEIPEEVVVSFKKIRYLSLINSSIELLESFKSRFDDMMNLESIFLKDTRHSSIREDVGKLWNELLSPQTTSKLKNLKNIAIDSNITTLMENSELHLDSHPFNNLTELFFSQPLEPSPFNNFFQHLSGKIDEVLVQSNLKKLCLESIILKRETKVKFPCLEKLWFGKSENIFIEVGDKLTSAKFSSLGCGLVENVLKSSPKLKTLSFSNISFPDGEDSNGFILKREVNPLYDLKKLELTQIYYDSRLENDIYKLNSKLETLHCTKLEELREDLFLNPFPKLKTLRIENNENIIGNRGKWPIRSTLKRLHFISLSLLEDEFFQENEFVSLEKLEIEDCGTLKGSGWSGFPQIQSIKFKLCRSIDDVFFQQQVFPKSFTKLEICSCYEVFGKGWNSDQFCNLTELKLEACFDMKDHLFQETEFPSLKRMYLNRVHKMTGENWKEMKKLKKIVSSRNNPTLQLKFDIWMLEEGIVVKQEDDGLDF